MWRERSPREHARKAPHVQLPLLVSGSCLTSPQETSGGVLGVKPHPPGGAEVRRRAWNMRPAYAAPAMHVAGQADTQSATSNCSSSASPGLAFTLRVPVTRSRPICHIMRLRWCLPKAHQGDLKRKHAFFSSRLPVISSRPGSESTCMGGELDAEGSERNSAGLVAAKTKSREAHFQGKSATTLPGTWGGRAECGRPGFHEGAWRRHGAGRKERRVTALTVHVVAHPEKASLGGNQTIQITSS